MNLIIQEISESNLQDLCGFPSKLIVDSILMPIFQNGQMTYQIHKLSSSYEKMYLEEDESNESYLIDSDKTAFLAYVDGNLAGQVLLKKYWNQYAHIWDIRVKESYRKLGIGKELIKVTRKWAKEQELSGISLETQNTNVAACLFYQRCGFYLGGLDRYLYRGLGNHYEMALHWYLLFEEEDVD